MLNLDTHILIFALQGRVSARERRLLSRRAWSISAIVLWELAKLRQLGRVEVDLEDLAVVAALSEVHVWPIDLKVCQRLRYLDFRSDAADELIAATSLEHRVPLLTRDKRLRASKLVPLAR